MLKLDPGLKEHGLVMGVRKSLKQAVQVAARDMERLRVAAILTFGLLLIVFQVVSTLWTPGGSWVERLGGQYAVFEMVAWVFLWTVALFKTKWSSPVALIIYTGLQFAYAFISGTWLESMQRLMSFDFAQKLLLIAIGLVLSTFLILYGKGLNRDIYERLFVDE